MDYYDVEIIWRIPGANGESARFSHITADTIKAGIEVFNADPVPAVPSTGDPYIDEMVKKNLKAIREQLDNPLPYADSDSMRTRLFTISELFGDSGVTCMECGAICKNLLTHRDWHNKLLP